MSDRPDTDTAASPRIMDTAEPTPTESPVVVLLSHLLDTAMERWDGEWPLDETAPAWLGLSFQQYAMYVEGRWDDLIQSVTSAWPSLTAPSSAVPGSEGGRG